MIDDEATDVERIGLEYAMVEGARPFHDVPNCRVAAQRRGEVLGPAPQVAYEPHEVAAVAVRVATPRRSVRQPLLDMVCGHEEVERGVGVIRVRLDAAKVAFELVDKIRRGLEPRRETRERHRDMMTPFSRLSLRPRSARSLRGDSLTDGDLGFAP